MINYFVDIFVFETLTILMMNRLPIDLIVEIGILAGPDEYEELAKTSMRNAIILQKPYIVNATNALICKRKSRNSSVTHGHEIYSYHGHVHNFCDMPAIVFSDGSQHEWYHHGRRHRDNDQPAVITADGYKAWYHHGHVHRDNDQPALIWGNGSKFWFQHDQIHRDNDQPAIIKSDGTKEWYQHGIKIK
jgi:hypothetical protein